MVNRAENVDVRRIEVEEGIITDAQYLLQDVMNEHGLSRADLARLSGMSKARITQLMRDDANPTLRTLAALFNVLGEEICIARKKKPCVEKFATPDISWSDYKFSTEKTHREISCLADGELDALLNTSLRSALHSQLRYSGKEQSFAANDNPALEELLEYA